MTFKAMGLVEKSWTEGEDKKMQSSKKEGEAAKETEKGIEREAENQRSVVSQKSREEFQGGSHQLYTTQQRTE